jgi:hypothetical protein
LIDAAPAIAFKKKERHLPRVRDRLEVPALRSPFDHLLKADGGASSQVAHGM